MRYTEIVTRLAALETVADGDQLIADYTARVGDEARARRELGWLTGELDWRLRDRALECMPGVEHPVMGRRKGPVAPAELLRLSMAAVAGEHPEHPLGPNAARAREELGYGVHGD